MKPQNISIRCDTCKIYIGPAYLCQDFYDVGIYKLCPLCYSSLNKNGFLYLGEKQVEEQTLIEIMLLDGTKTLVSREKLC